MFGHDITKCKKGTKVVEEIRVNADSREENRAHSNKDEGLIEVNYRKNGGNGKAENKSVSNQFGGGIRRYENNDRNKNGVYRRKEILKEGHNSNQNEGTEMKTSSQTGGKDNEGRRTDQDEILTAILKSNNKYSVLENEEVNEEQELRKLKDRMIVDQYLKKSCRPQVQRLETRPKI